MKYKKIYILWNDTQMEIEKAKKIFPEYFKNFTLPDCARAQEIEVYRACPTRKVEKASFLNSYEENGFSLDAGSDASDPGEYSLSTYTRLKDVARFVKIDSRYQPPFGLAKGKTAIECGPCCATKEWKNHYRSSHVDWWLYEGAEPWAYFDLIDYENEKQYLSQTTK